MTKDYVLCEHCGYPQTQMAARFRAFAEGLDVTGVSLEVLMLASPEECRQTGQAVLEQLNARKKTDLQEILRLQGIIEELKAKNHQTSSV